MLALSFSESGTQETCQPRPPMSAVRGTADSTRTSPWAAFDPERTWGCPHSRSVATEYGRADCPKPRCGKCRLKAAVRLAPAASDFLKQSQI
jgi:hypothetical protein